MQQILSCIIPNILLHDILYRFLWPFLTYSLIPWSPKLHTCEYLNSWNDQGQGTLYPAIILIILIVCFQVFPMWLSFA